MSNTSDSEHNIDEDSKDDHQTISDIPNQHDSMSDDPGQWPKKLTDSECYLMVKRGPVQVKNRIFTKNREGHRFNESHYYMNMKNKERIGTSWLLYSQSKHCVMCFCCQLFVHAENTLSGNGYNNWNYLFFFFNLLPRAPKSLNPPLLPM